MFTAEWKVSKTFVYYNYILLCTLDPEYHYNIVSLDLSNVFSVGRGLT